MTQHREAASMYMFIYMFLSILLNFSPFQRRRKKKYIYNLKNATLSYIKKKRDAIKD